MQPFNSRTPYTQARGAQKKTRGRTPKQSRGRSTTPHSAGHTCDDRLIPNREPSNVKAVVSSVKLAICSVAVVEEQQLHCFQEGSDIVVESSRVARRFSQSYEYEEICAGIERSHCYDQECSSGADLSGRIHASSPAYDADETWNSTRGRHTIPDSLGHTYDNRFIPNRTPSNSAMGRIKINKDDPSSCSPSNTEQGMPKNLYMDNFVNARIFSDNSHPEIVQGKQNRLVELNIANRTNFGNKYVPRYSPSKCEMGSNAPRTVNEHGSDITTHPSRIFRNKNRNINESYKNDENTGIDRSHFYDQESRYSRGPSRREQPSSAGKSLTPVTHSTQACDAQMRCTWWKIPNTSPGRSTTADNKGHTYDQRFNPNTATSTGAASHVKMNKDDPLRGSPGDAERRIAIRGRGEYLGNVRIISDNSSPGIPQIKKDPSSSSTSDAQHGIANNVQGKNLGNVKILSDNSSPEIPPINKVPASSSPGDSEGRMGKTVEGENLNNVKILSDNSSPEIPQINKDPSSSSPSDTEDRIARSIEGRNLGNVKKLSDNSSPKIPQGHQKRVIELNNANNKTNFGNSHTPRYISSNPERILNTPHTANDYLKSSRIFTNKNRNIRKSYKNDENTEIGRSHFYNQEASCSAGSPGRKQSSSTDNTFIPKTPSTEVGGARKKTWWKTPNKLPGRSATTDSKGATYDDRSISNGATSNAAVGHIKANKDDPSSGSPSDTVCVQGEILGDVKMLPYISSPEIPQANKDDLFSGSPSDTVCEKANGVQGENLGNVKMLSDISSPEIPQDHQNGVVELNNANKNNFGNRQTPICIYSEQESVLDAPHTVNGGGSDISQKVSRIELSSICKPFETVESTEINQQARNRHSYSAGSSGRKQSSKTPNAQTHYALNKTWTCNPDIPLVKSKTLQNICPTFGDRFIPSRGVSDVPVSRIKVRQILRNKPGKANKRNRYVPSEPEIILRAPNIVDDYYLNLVDWHSNNTLALALGCNLYLWNAETNTTEFLCSVCESEYICSVRWMQQGFTLAVGSSTGSVQIVDCERKKCLRTMMTHTARVSSIDWNSYILTCGSRVGAIHNYDVRSQNYFLSNLESHTLEVCGLKWSLDGKYLASGANDHVVNIWPIAYQQLYPENRPLFSFSSHRSAVKALAWCPFERNVLLTGGGTADWTIKVWNINTGRYTNSIDSPSQVGSLLWSTRSKEFVSCHSKPKSQVIIWKYPELTRVTELRSHKKRVLHLALSPDGTTVLSAGADETLCLWKCFDMEKAVKPFEETKVFK